MASNGGAHTEEKPCSPAAEHRDEAERENSSVSVQHSTSPAACPDEAPELPSLASESNGRDHSLGAQSGQSESVDSDGIAAAEGSKQRAAGKSREKKEEKEKDSFHFSKGAYFIGKCVWGKVSLQKLLSPSPHSAQAYHGSVYRPHEQVARGQGHPVRTLLCRQLLCPHNTVAT